MPVYIFWDGEGWYTSSEVDGCIHYVPYNGPFVGNWIDANKEHFDSEEEVYEFCEDVIIVKEEEKCV